ncbi:phosphohistidine phosphatase SixA [Pleurocapsa sp. PCC 7319]|uniref:phosphohistidine phosphatase SixA n=1 Tax=Pleurocapsa sp. PCC 7319 TaxID=118161 RepID=UPI0003458B24|nr:phosphohistidine phosphatase SixA [Pleurocapsa sp. PCC 7319]
MQVYLVRHGIAAPREDYHDDKKRPLTNQGRQKTTKVAERLLSVGVKFDLILSSPLIRASQTAEILQQAGLSKTVDAFDPLKPEGDIEQWLTWLQSWQLQNANGTLALVGHQPNLGNWAETLIWGTVKQQIVVKKSGIIGLQLPSIGTPISRSTLFLLLSPKWII